MPAFDRDERNARYTCASSAIRIHARGEAAGAPENPREISRRRRDFIPRRSERFVSRSDPRAGSPIRSQRARDRGFRDSFTSLAHINYARQHTRSGLPTAGRLGGLPRRSRGTTVPRKRAGPGGEAEAHDLAHGRKKTGAGEEDEDDGVVSIA